MGIKQLYNDNLRKLPNEYGDVSVMNNSDTNVFTFGNGMTSLNKLSRFGPVQLRPKSIRPWVVSAYFCKKFRSYNYPLVVG